jgi:hypothetical protein
MLEILGLRIQSLMNTSSCLHTKVEVVEKYGGYHYKPKKPL